MKAILRFTAMIVILVTIWWPLLAQEHNIGYYEKIYDDGVQSTWARVWSDHFPEVADEQVQPGDLVSPWGGGSGDSCGTGPLTGYEIGFRSADKSESGAREEEPLDLPDIVVTASPPSSPSYMLAFLPYRGSSGGGCRDSAPVRCASSIPIGDAIIRPPNPLRECDTGDPVIDDTADLREQLWAEGQGDGSLPLEEAALFWPDGQGGYDVLRYGVEIPGGGPGQCRFAVPPSHESFPPAAEWPEGVIFFHTHPFNPGSSLPTSCGPGGIAGFSPSPRDREHLRWLEQTFDTEVQGVVMDPNVIHRFGADQSDDEEPTMRCR
ncbi:MAG: hypothetical protein ACPGJE_00920 [Wenzhouxiangellaceae bacterium]